MESTSESNDVLAGGTGGVWGRHFWRRFRNRIRGHVRFIWTNSAVWKWKHFGIRKCH